MDDGIRRPANIVEDSRAPSRRTVLATGLRLASLPALLSGLAACAGGDFGGGSPAPASAPALTAQPISSGGPAVALILPLTAQGNAGAVGVSLRNAAELAVSELGAAPVTLIVKDDGGNSQGARAAAEAAIAEGARIILGPLFSHSVGAVAQVARPRGIPIIAFSTDSNVASQGVYLLSFLPQTDVNRIISYSTSQARRSFIGFIPENAYGSVAEGAFQQSAGALGGRIMGIERFTQDRARLQAAAQRAAGVAGQADAIFIPDSADGMPAVLQALATAGIDLRRVRPIGTGLWDDQRLFGNPQMEGAQFAAPETSGWRGFAERYRARFGTDPVRTATLAYDAVSLVASVVRTQGPNGLTDAALTNPSGFNGVDGVFRFRADGTNERGLAVMEIKGGAAQVVSPAPRSFSTF